MTCITNMTIVLVAVAALMIPAVIAYAGPEQESTQQTDNTVGSIGHTGSDYSNPEYNATKASADPALTQEQIDMRIDELVDKIGELYLENHQLYEAVSDEVVSNRQALDDKIAQNNQTIQTLRKELDILHPIPPDIYIPDDDIALMESAMLALSQSGLPLHEMVINHATGTLDLIAHIDKKYPRLEDDIKKYTKDIPIVITYSKNTARLQSGCNSSTGYCDLLVGGIKGEDKYWGLPCTISLAAKQTTSGGGIESGVIIPDHCNKQTTTYYQPNNDNEASRSEMRPRTVAGFATVIL